MEEIARGVGRTRPDRDRHQHDLARREARDGEGLQETAGLAVILGETRLARIEGPGHVAKPSQRVYEGLGRGRAVPRNYRDAAPHS